MTPYREPSAPLPPPTFEMRTEPLTLSVVILLIGLASTTPGLLALAEGIVRVSIGGCAIGGVFTLLGIGIVWLAIRGITTKVRVTLEDKRVRLEWSCLGRAVRHEVLDRDAIVDVGLDITRSEKGDVQRIVVGTRNEDFPLDDSKGSMRAGYDKQVRALATFLGVPVRPQ